MVKHGKLRICFVNICSLYNKISDLNHILKSQDVDIACVVESWLNSDISNSELLIFGYKVFRLDRTAKKGGGVILFIKSTISFEPENSFISDTCELIHVSINHGIAKPLQLIVLYRPPSTKIDDFNDVLCNFLNNINYSDFPLIITGDFNFDLNSSKKHNLI